ncbi:Farnesyl pyrophosphate synthase [Folsomia candida]|uniref:Farnesyl pyrophosphate synthase n=1 Tax=Folsomia candida TaxID=158441 RepID=A0A226D5F8_FOLCA|nr:Farnesyl pyrophosphate synthase [Folsomia candida]
MCTIYVLIFAERLGKRSPKIGKRIEAGIASNALLSYFVKFENPDYPDYPWVLLKLATPKPTKTRNTPIPKNPGSIPWIEELVLEIELLFQMQDDYLDCYGDPEATGKVETDIVENKCSWLIVTALEKAKPAHRKILEELAIEEEFHKFEEECYASILAKIHKLSNQIPAIIFMETAEVIYRRNK